ncbi:uncharacterized protein DS421_16g546720 [Arachis hypogaea]|nr:uncharacterized protein DS421_16g546720 [Arachis hypogaea]
MPQHPGKNGGCSKTAILSGNNGSYRPPFIPQKTAVLSIGYYGGFPKTAVITRMAPRITAFLGGASFGHNGGSNRRNSPK